MDSNRTARSEGATRTCVGCRTPDHRDALLRFAVRDEAPFVAPDPRHRLGGRGVSVHPTRSCLSLAVRRGGFARALRRKVDLRVDDLGALASRLYAERLVGLLGGARRARQLAVGTDAVRASLRDGRAHLLLLATDAAGRRDELSRIADAAAVPCVSHGTKGWLGELLDRDEVGVISILDEGIAREVARAAECVVELSEDG